MTYFETPDDRDAFYAGMTPSEWSARQSAAEQEAESDEVDSTSERFVSEHDYFAADRAQARDDFDAQAEWEAAREGTFTGAEIAVWN